MPKVVNSSTTSSRLNSKWIFCNTYSSQNEDWIKRI